MHSLVGVDKACPLVLRRSEGVNEFMAFRHPSLGKQLVKGTIEKGEPPAQAACRELVEESGLIAMPDPYLLCRTDDLPDADLWYFFICQVGAPIPDRWSFFTKDDGGHVFRFFWQPIEQELDDEWHPLYHTVMEFLHPKLTRHLGLRG